MTTDRAHRPSSELAESRARPQLRWTVGDRASWPTDGARAAGLPAHAGVSAPPAFFRVAGVQVDACDTLENGTMSERRARQCSFLDEAVRRTWTCSASSSHLLIAASSCCLYLPSAAFRRRSRTAPRSRSSTVVRVAGRWSSRSAAKLRYPRAGTARRASRLQPADGCNSVSVAAGRLRRARARSAASTGCASSAAGAARGRSVRPRGPARGVVAAGVDVKVDEAHGQRIGHPGCRRCSSSVRRCN